MASKPSKYREIPVAEVHEGCWVKYRVLDVVYQGTLELFLGSVLALREGAEVTPLFSRGVDGRFHYAPHVYMEDLHVYEKVEDEEAESSGDDEIGDVDVPEPTNEMITRIDELKPGDVVAFGYKSLTVTGIVRRIEPYVEPGTHCVFLVDDEDGLIAGGKDHYVLRSAYRPKYVLPQEPGFYKAHTGSVWKFDGRHWVPVLDHKGSLAPAVPKPIRKPNSFRRDSIEKDRFPFVKVSLTVDEA